jgi:hypothetical protein
MTRNADWNRSTTHLAQNCYLFPRDKVSPVSQRRQNGLNRIATRQIPQHRLVEPRVCRRFFSLPFSSSNCFSRRISSGMTCSATRCPSALCFKTNAFSVSENSDAFVSSAHPNQGNYKWKTLTQNDPNIKRQSTLNSCPAHGLRKCLYIEIGAITASAGF